MTAQAVKTIKVTPHACSYKKGLRDVLSMINAYDKDEKKRTADELDAIVTDIYNFVKYVLKGTGDGDDSVSE